ncbi:hypothetical protein [Sulfuricurvum sp.]|uniref:hypothetical protein n=1 Tax=Sulfuricurvum sp. TaxID=2025608 RepID=UPI0026289CB7|nr:hypothetical protein [Sulfuricurvum sp.]MDD2267478.1 hypothetical protein [Sulfuricurvum sp.]MDD2783974.1 hypothetical protein [Sulfuricurvum sp.]
MPQPTDPQSTDNQNTPESAVDPKEALTLKKAQIQILEAELSDVDAKLDAEFLDKIPSMLTEDEMDMRLDDDIRAFVSMIEDKREAFYREKLTDLKGRIDGMKSEVSHEEEMNTIEDAKKEFLEAHPECDFAALSDFVKNDVTPRQKEELYSAATYLDMLEMAYSMFTKKKPSVKKEEPAQETNLPPDFNDAPSSAVVGDPTPVVKDKEYLARIGVRS